MGILGDPLFSAALAMGLVGGLHCVGMCGAIVTALSISNAQHMAPKIGLYHLGRVMTYALFGLVFGLTGALIENAAPFLWAQKGLAILAGIVMIALAAQLGGWIPDKLPVVGSGLIPSTLLRRAIEGSFWPWPIVGLVNGLIPCGLVYAAIALALASADPLSGSVLMILFGVGTIPALLGVTFVARVINPSKRATLLRLASIGVALFGAFMIYKATVIGERPLDMGLKKGTALIESIEERADSERVGR